MDLYLALHTCAAWIICILSTMHCCFVQQASNLVLLTSAPSSLLCCVKIDGPYSPVHLSFHAVLHSCNGIHAMAFTQWHSCHGVHAMTFMKEKNKKPTPSGIILGGLAPKRSTRQLLQKQQSGLHCLWQFRPLHCLTVGRALSLPIAPSLDQFVGAFNRVLICFPEQSVSLQWHSCR